MPERDPIDALLRDLFDPPEADLLWELPDAVFMWLPWDAPWGEA